MAKYLVSTISETYGLKKVFSRHHKRAPAEESALKISKQKRVPISVFKIVPDTQGRMIKIIVSYKSGRKYDIPF